MSPHHPLGAPLSSSQRAEYEEALIQRFGGDIEKAVNYMESVTNAQITRASGILSSVSILAGMSYFVKAPLALITALVSLILVATMLYLPWPRTPDHVRDPKLEFDQMCRRFHYRAFCNRICITLVILTILFLVPYVLRSI